MPSAARHAHACAAPAARPSGPLLQHYRKNQYEEALFRAEDDHFELDMIIDQNWSAINALRVGAAQRCPRGALLGLPAWRSPKLRRRLCCCWPACCEPRGIHCMVRPSSRTPLQPLAAQLEAMNEEERAGWQLPEKALRAFHYRAVQRIYGEQGAQVRGHTARRA